VAGEYQFHDRFFIEWSGWLFVILNNLMGKPDEKGFSTAQQILWLPDRLADCVHHRIPGTGYPLKTGCKFPSQRKR
jgi:hypothetical protein